ncbi:PREDICTED: transmembrane protein 56-A-like [Branchiostoma belcheri]|uniref:Transmembrane protein 56-A-like n=1 Tax=Branchiostoma belcheri TaxID=7741 RepID=A0A6P4ZBC3_BRABE|nr:PREDICTED: transmembrane protein 56-A-like [Branchiostoma belcheri]
MDETVSICLAVLASFAVSMGLFAAAPKILSRLSTQYRLLGPQKRALTDHEFKSVLVNIVLGSVGVYVFLFDPEVYPRRVRYNCLLLRHGVAGYLGYTIADAFLLVRYRLHDTNVFLIHHVVGTLCGLAGTIYTSVPWIMSTFLYYEASNPFVHFRAILSALGMKKTRLYIVNGLMMIAVFFLCRVAIIPVYWRTVYLLYIDGSFPQIDTFVYYLMIYGRLFFDVLNVYWFSLMMRAAFAIFVWPKLDAKIQD